MSPADAARRPGYLWRADAPHTHTQIKDRSGEEPMCPADDHHYVAVDPDDEEGAWICTRCGDSATADD